MSDVTPAELSSLADRMTGIIEGYLNELGKLGVPATVDLDGGYYIGYGKVEGHYRIWILEPSPFSGDVLKMFPNLENLLDPSKKDLSRTSRDKRAKYLVHLPQLLKKQQSAANELRDAMQTALDLIEKLEVQ
jgi:hypothetical protein